MLEQLQYMTNLTLKAKVTCINNIQHLQILVINYEQFLAHSWICQHSLFCLHSACFLQFQILFYYKYNWSTNVSRDNNIPQCQYRHISK